MPTYEYLCQRCGQQFEVFQSFKDKPLKAHAECGGDVQKVFHASGVVFKGSGFYVTDSRRKASSDSSKSSDAGSPGSKESASKGSGSKEAKTAASAASSPAKASESSGSTSD